MVYFIREERERERRGTYMIQNANHYMTHDKSWSGLQIDTIVPLTVIEFTNHLTATAGNS